MPDNLTAKDLKRRFKEVWPKYDHDKGEEPALRIRRAISWVERAQAEKDTDDPDAKFIFYWIAFNATYAQDVSDKDPALFYKYFFRVVKLDPGIIDSIWNKISDSIEGILRNRYIFRQFWNFHISDGLRGDNWKTEFDNHIRAFENARNVKDIHQVSNILTILFKRLYTMRCQFFHGSSSWNSPLNRAQVKDGVRIMESLVPLFICAMINDPDRDWGPPRYPRHPEIRER